MTRKLCLVTLLLSSSLVFAQAAATPTPAPQSAPAQATPSPTPDPWIGKWKLDVAKSKFHDLAPKQETLTIDAASRSSIKYSIKGTGANGAPYTESFQGKPDGREYSLLRDGQPIARISY